MLDGYLDDLLQFANRDDVPVLVQAAVVHAQFESIHPFTDGNGRIGRALINTVLRRRGITSQLVVPLASALDARRDIYFAVLIGYRKGNAGPIVQALTQAAKVAALQSQHSAELLATLPKTWATMYVEDTGKLPRANSAARRILDNLLSTPFFTAEQMQATTGSPTSSKYDAIDRLVSANILRPLTARARDQIWCASLIIDELKDLGDRVERQTNADSIWLGIQRRALAALAQHG